jgi:hypothetical protein
MPRFHELIRKSVPLSLLLALSGCDGTHVTRRQVLSVTGGGLGESWIVVHEVEGNLGSDVADSVALPVIDPRLAFGAPQAALLVLVQRQVPGGPTCFSCSTAQSRASEMVVK